MTFSLEALCLLAIALALWLIFLFGTGTVS